MTYKEFLENKRFVLESSGFDIDKSELNPMLYDFQKDIVEWERKIREKYIDDFANVLKENYDYLPQILSQEAFGLYIDEYAEQLKAGGENE